MRVVDRYRRDMEAARRRLAALDRRTVETQFGKVEYIDQGEGPVVLVIHGITQGADGGLRGLAADLVPPGYRVIVPSRFGYLGSEMPTGATPEMQADAFAALLDAIGVRRVVVLAGSAGSTSALHFAIRHHDRTRALLLVSANVPGPHQSKGMPPRAVFRAIFASDPVAVAHDHVPTQPDGEIEPGAARPGRCAADRGGRVEDPTSDGRCPPGEAASDGRGLRCLRVEPRINQIDLSEVPVPTMILHARDDYRTSISGGGRHGPTDPVRTDGYGRSWRSSDAGKAPCGDTRTRGVPRRVPPRAQPLERRGGGMNSRVARYSDQLHERTSSGTVRGRMIEQEV